MQSAVTGIDLDVFHLTSTQSIKYKATAGIHKPSHILLLCALRAITACVNKSLKSECNNRNTGSGEWTMSANHLIIHHYSLNKDLCF